MAEYDEAEILDRARRCRKIAVDAEHDQRAREREDLLFQLPENQWTPEAKKERTGGPDRPGRPMLSISLLKQPMQLVYNQFTKARLGVNLHPTGEDADKELVEIKQGLYRRIERDGGAAQARGWAFLRALAAGRGFYRIVKQYDEDSDPKSNAAWDQEIAYQRILHQESVYMDPAAQEADYSDAKWAFVEAWLSKADFRARYPKSRASQADGKYDWEGLENEAPGWVKAAADDRDEQGVLVCEYWWVDEQREEIIGPGGRKRERVKRTVYCAKTNGLELLEPVIRWDGRYIPLVPVIGEELIPVDGDRIWQGMIRPARDGQMAYNYAISSAVEDISRVSKAPYVGAAGAFDGHPEWQTANIRNHPYLEYNTVDILGKPAPPPQPMPVDGTKMQLSFALADQARGMVQSATAIYEPSLGEAPQKREAQSGRAILALQQQADAGTSQFVQNLVNISLRHEARIVLDLMPHVYDRAGRITAMVTGEDETKPVMLGLPFTIDPATGGPVKAPPNTPGAKVYDLSRGRYGIVPDIGKSHQTRFEAGQQFLTEIVNAVPAAAEFAMDLFFKYQDAPGSKELAERFKRLIQSKYPNLFDETKGSPEEMQAQLSAAQQQLQMLQGQLQQAVQVIQTKQVEKAAEVEKVRVQKEMDLKIQELRNAGAITVAQIQAASKGVQEVTRAENEALATGQEQDHELEMQSRDQAHEMAMAAAGGQSMTMSRSEGQDEEREEGHEMGMGDSGEDSREHTREHMPMGSDEE